MTGRAVGLLLAGFLALPAMAAELRLDGALMQGGLVTGMAVSGARVSLDDKPVAVAPDGSFAIGFGRDAKPAAALAVVWPDGRRETRMLDVTPRQWNIQRIDGLPPRSVSPSPEDLARIKAESALLAEARRRATPESWFRGGFSWPASGTISGVYGSQRILNGEPRQPHLGVDVAAPEGTPVLAAADGVVSLAHDDMFFTGKTVTIDHGLGVGTIYAHLSDLTVKAGQRVRRGDRIGSIGKTGRVTGAHLHWGMTWREERLDPSLAIGPAPAIFGQKVALP